MKPFVDIIWLVIVIKINYLRLGTVIYEKSGKNQINTFSFQFLKILRTYTMLLKIACQKLFGLENLDLFKSNIII